MKRLSNFTVCLLMAITMVIGLCVLPLTEVSLNPPKHTGGLFTISCSWNGASPRVMENSVTSVIEGLVSSVRGVEEVTSESISGKAKIFVRMKKGTDMSSARFQMASLLRQCYSNMPEGVEYPVLSGGEAVNFNEQQPTIPLVTYTVSADIPKAFIKKKIENELVEKIKNIDGVKDVVISGDTEEYVCLTYNPLTLAHYGITATDITEAVRSYTGRYDVVGSVVDNDSKQHSLHLAMTQASLDNIPVKTNNGEIIFLNDIVTLTPKKYEPKSYHRINGQNTVTMRVDIDGNANAVRISDKIQQTVEREVEHLADGIILTMAYDAAADERTELYNLLIRSFLSLLILLLLAWVSSCDVRYLLVIAISLAASILLALLVYQFAGIRLHIYSMAGMAISFSLVIDATIVMADHYAYFRNGRAFLPILASVSTTIGALCTTALLPQQWQENIHDFVLVICANLVVSIVVTFLFVPTLVDLLKYKGRHIRHRVNLAVKWNRFYMRYVMYARHFRWAIIAIVVLSFVGTLIMFVSAVGENNTTLRNNELRLIVRGQMPLGGKTAELNEKVVMVEEYLKGFPQIKRFVTNVTSRGAHIDVSFHDSCLQTGTPYIIEQKVIGRLIGIGGADWSTHGVNQIGFSNSVALQHRQYELHISGYNYDHVSRYAEQLTAKLSENPRVQDVITCVPGHENTPDELFVEYNKERMLLLGITARDVHTALNELLTSKKIGLLKYGVTGTDVWLTAESAETFDYWRLENEYIIVGENNIRLSDVASIKSRKSKEVIARCNQEYVISVMFNVLGTYDYIDELITTTVDDIKRILPTGYQCALPEYIAKSNEAMPWWIVAVIAVIIFFICAILFESLRMSLAVVLTIPASFIGLFLTYSLLPIEAGAGCLAAMIMLAGVTVNSAIYLLAEYKTIYRMNNVSHLSPIRIYLKAYNHKIRAIMLTVMTTVLGLLPFLLDNSSDTFWRSFASGTIGGLLFSLVVIIFLLPSVCGADSGNTTAKRG